MISSNSPIVRDSKILDLMGVISRPRHGRVRANVMKSIFLAFITSFITIMLLLHIVDLADLAVNFSQPPSSSTSDTLPLINKTDFIDRWLASDFGEPFDLSPIANACLAQTWRTDIILDLYGADGGIGNVRTQVLDFIFLAVHIGAPIVLPKYVKRSEVDLLDFWYTNDKNGLHEFEHYFDQEHFINNMKIACPEMAIYNSREEVPGRVLKELWRPPMMRPDKNPNQNIEGGIKDFEQWVIKQDDYNGQDMNLVTIFKTLWNYDLSTRPLQRRAFSKLIRPRPEIRRLAATAIFKLRERFNLSREIDPTKSIYRNGYYGAHLRTESDAEGIGWLKKMGGFQTQAEAHIKLSSDASLNTIYLACGKPEDVQKFTQMALEKAGIRVTNKVDLLDEDDLQELQSLSWDQQAIVDYEVLGRSGFFAGSTMSSFTWMIATRRNQFLQNDERRHHPYEIQEVDPNTTYDDGISRIILRNPQQDIFSLEFVCPEGMWP